MQETSNPITHTHRQTRLRINLRRQQPSLRNNTGGGGEKHSIRPGSHDTIATIPEELMGKSQNTVLPSQMHDPLTPTPSSPGVAFSSLVTQYSTVQDELVAQKPALGHSNQYMSFPCWKHSVCSEEQWEGSFRLTLLSLPSKKCDLVDILSLLDICSGLFPFCSTPLETKSGISQF